MSLDMSILTLMKKEKKAGTPALTEL